ncbi:MAG: hypothetical protein KGR98_06125 [Verrucomicrobia bacterium]|nr:hypothetical protein [Verrucomicrobiota bacterium]MDE3098775.1 hypothetical protein [Verrucomicrobiota bacterium]
MQLPLEIAPEIDMVAVVNGQKFMQFHRFAYSTPLRYGEEPNLSKIRDGAAFGELTAPLTKLGYEYGHIVFNAPFNPRKKAGLGRENFNFIKPDDLIVLTTRPPLDDKEHGDKKLVLPSGTHLEKQIFDECRKFLAVCARSHVKLTETVGAKTKRAELVFHQHKGARLKNYRGLKDFRSKDVPRNSDISIGFFLRVRAIPEYGCGLLASFGMGGRETLIWNRIVRTRHADWLNRCAFIVAEMNLAKIPETPLTLEFVDQIKVKVLVEHHIE